MTNYRPVPHLPFIVELVVAKQLCEFIATKTLLPRCPSERTFDTRNVLDNRQYFELSDNIWNPESSKRNATKLKKMPVIFCK